MKQFSLYLSLFFSNMMFSQENINTALAHLFSKPNQPFFITWMSYNPSEEIKKLEIPVLIINGTKDLHVKVEEAKKLHEAFIKK